MKINARNIGIFILCLLLGICMTVQTKTTDSEHAFVSEWLFRKRNSVKNDTAAFEGVNARDCFYCCCFSGAVMTDKSVYIAGLDDEVQVVDYIGFTVIAFFKI